MDQIKIGKFIAELRKEKGMTQEKLGEKLGVTNKTISRWENGNYMPDIEMLSLLSKEFSVSINELIVGERLAIDDFREAADNNLIGALENSTFTLKEKIDYFKKKWLKEHIATIIGAVVLCVASLLILKLCSVEITLIAFILGIVAVLLYIVLYNRMMMYVENNAYPTIKNGSQKEKDD